MKSTVFLRVVISKNTRSKSLQERHLHSGFTSKGIRIKDSYTCVSMHLWYERLELKMWKTRCTFWRQKDVEDRLILPSKYFHLCSSLGTKEKEEETNIKRIQKAFCLWISWFLMWMWIRFREKAIRPMDVFSYPNKDITPVFVFSDREAGHPLDDDHFFPRIRLSVNKGKRRECERETQLCMKTCVYQTLTRRRVQ